MDKDYNCPHCGSKPERICSIRNLHLIGDPKSVSIYRCHKCNINYLFIYLHAHLGYGDNLLLYRIELTAEEAGKLSKLIAQCPDLNNEDCKCSVHDTIDLFESANSHRRQVLLDDVDRW